MRKSKWSFNWNYINKIVEHYYSSLQIPVTDFCHHPLMSSSCNTLLIFIIVRTHGEGTVGCYVTFRLRHTWIEHCLCIAFGSHHGHTSPEQCWSNYFPSQSIWMVWRMERHYWSSCAITSCSMLLSGSTPPPRWAPARASRQNSCLCSQTWHPLPLWIYAFVFFPQHDVSAGHLRTEYTEYLWSLFTWFCCPPLIPTTFQTLEILFPCSLYKWSMANWMRLRG